MRFAFPPYGKKYGPVSLHDMISLNRGHYTLGYLEKVELPGFQIDE